MLRGYRIIPDPEPTPEDRGNASRERTELIDAFAEQCRAEGWFNDARRGYCDRGHARLLAQVRAFGGPVTALEIIRHYGLPRNTVRRGLYTLTQRGELRRVKDGKEYRYVVEDTNA